MSEAPLLPAGTLILVRECEGRAPELLMVQRAESMAFGASAWVFPGGRVDPEDVALAAAILGEDGPLDDYAARVAAIRETIEEAGIAIAIDPLPDADLLGRIRAALHEGEGFAAVLDRHALRLVPEALLPFSRWQPSHAVPRRFDTRFYIARATADAAFEADGTETIAICWTAPGAMLARDDARIMFPTACNLRRIAALPDFTALAAHAALFPESFVSPEIREIEGLRYLCVPEDQGYEGMRMILESALRA